MQRFLLVLLVMLCSPALADPVADLKGCIVDLNTDALEAHIAGTGNYPASPKQLGISLPIGAEPDWKDPVPNLGGLPRPARTTQELDFTYACDDSAGYLLEEPTSVLSH